MNKPTIHSISTSITLPCKCNIEHTVITTHDEKLNTFLEFGFDLLKHHINRKANSHKCNKETNE